jgi:hypothetical protein
MRRAHSPMTLQTHTFTAGRQGERKATPAPSRADDRAGVPRRRVLKAAQKEYTYTDYTKPLFTAIVDLSIALTTTQRRPPANASATPHAAYAAPTPRTRDL